MLNKRIVGVITVKDGWAVQSFGYARYLPLGRPEILAKNLDRWGADEIILLRIDRTGEEIAAPDFRLLERVAAQSLSTPLIYGGGIRSVAHAIDVVHAGADRIIVDAMLGDAPETVVAIEAHLGAQAIIGAIPMSVEAQGLTRLDYRTRSLAPIGETILDLIRRRSFSEMMAIDWRHDGGTTFDTRILDHLVEHDLPVIAFGGLQNATQVRAVLTRPQVVAVAVGNALNYREHAIRQLKLELTGLPIRLPSHQRWIHA